MPDLSLQFGIRVLADTIGMPPGDAIRFVFDHYRCAKPDAQDGLVLALIAEIATLRARRQDSHGSTPLRTEGAAA